MRAAKCDGAMTPHDTRRFFLYTTKPKNTPLFKWDRVPYETEQFLLLSRLVRNCGCGKRLYLVNGGFGGGVSSSGLSE